MSSNISHTNNITNPSNPYSANLSELFRDKSVKLISDPEGYSFAHLLNQKDESPELASESEPLIVLGDLLDSAIAVTATGNILKMGNLAELKSHNLDNLLQCRENPNIHVMFGNRDLNKLKVLPLAKVKAPFAKPVSHATIRAFLNPLTADISYFDLAKQLQSNINNKNWEWEIPDLKHWYPFWKSYSKETQVYKLWKDGRHLSHEQVMTCLERFFLIFGADNADGTISAHNSLYCITKEVLGADFATKFPKFANKVTANTDINLGKYKEILTKCDEPSNTGLKEELDLAAALVLTVYMRMFYPKQESNNKYIARNSNLKYDGLLYDFYTSPQTYFCAYATQTKRLLSFSHGGITKNFLDTEYASRYDTFFEDDNNYKLMTELSGGYHGKVKGGTTTSVITTGIQKFNETYKSILVKVIHNYLYSKNYAKTDINPNNWAWTKSKKPTATQIQKPDYNKPTKALVKFMAMTAPFDSCQHNYGNELCTVDGDKKKPAIKSIDYSPISPGIVELRKPENTLFCSDSDLVQFIGHSPQGFGATIDLFTSNNTSNNTHNTHKTYNINLDISNTALSHDTIADLNKLSDNYFYMVYGNGGTLKTHGEIHVATGKGDKFKDIGDTIKYDSTYDILSEQFKNYLMKTDPANEKAFMHGKLHNHTMLYTYVKQNIYDFIPMQAGDPDNANSFIDKQFSFLNSVKTGGNRKKQHSYQKTKRNISKKYKRAQTKKLKRK